MPSPRPPWSEWPTSSMLCALSGTMSAFGMGALPGTVIAHDDRRATGCHATLFGRIRMTVGRSAEGPAALVRPGRAWAIGKLRRSGLRANRMDAEAAGGTGQAQQIRLGYQQVGRTAAVGRAVAGVRPCPVDQIGPVGRLR